jgi:Tol biopolymer transport system component
MCTRREAPEEDIIVNMLSEKIIDSLLLVVSTLFLCCEKEVAHPAPTQIDIDTRADTVFDVKYPFWSGDGSKILFFGHVVGDDGDGLYEVAPEGGSPTLLMVDSMMKRHPVLSPDGSKIAYLGASMIKLWGAARVWVMNRDGSGAKDLTPMGGNWEYTRWSPDSRHVLFDGGVEEKGIVQYQIIRADVETGELKMLTRHPFHGRDASYTSDGTKIVFVSDFIQSEYGGKVWVMDADGTSRVPLDSSNRTTAFPRIRPGTNELWFSFGMDNSYDEGVYFMDLDRVQVPARKKDFKFKSKEYFLRECQWSPDGRRLISLYATSSRTPDLYLTSSDSLTCDLITFGFHVVLFSHAWSPDAAGLVFYAIPKGEDASAIFTYNVHSSTLQRLTILNN